MVWSMKYDSTTSGFNVVTCYWNIHKLRIRELWSVLTLFLCEEKRRSRFKHAACAVPLWKQTIAFIFSESSLKRGRGEHSGCKVRSLRRICEATWVQDFLAQRSADLSPAPHSRLQHDLVLLNRKRVWLRLEDNGVILTHPPNQCSNFSSVQQTLIQHPVILPCHVPNECSLCEYGGDL